jgi:uncharacterized protein YdiU (UPF0061 family)
MKFSNLKLTAPYLNHDPLFYDRVEPTPLEKPFLIAVSQSAAQLLGVDEDLTLDEELVSIVNGEKKLEGSETFAMCYAGHQFGHFVPRLGDGRAINLGKVKGQNLQLKGSGLTLYSRQGDGRAVLRSSIREFLMSEAMHGLGIETSRALALIGSHTDVARKTWEKGAIVLRLSPTWVRFGTFEYFYAANEHEKLKELAEYVMDESFPELKGDSNLYAKMYAKIVKNTATTIARWQSVGFCHGVMNTDNLSILGLTIDYGPYGWLEDYNPDCTPNTTDAEHRRYRYGNQPSIGLWNLTRLANAIYPLIEDAKPLEAILKEYQVGFQEEYLVMMLSKIGVFTVKEGDKKLINDLQTLMTKSEVDMTLFFRNLNQFDDENPTNVIEYIAKDSYLTKDEFEKKSKEWSSWLFNYSERLSIEKLSKSQRVERMNAINPKYVLRNYMAQLAIDAADKADYSVIDELYNLLKNPYNEQPEMQKWFAKRPDWANDKVGCSMLSCSS